MLGGDGPPAERRGVLGAPFAYRAIRRTDTQHVHTTESASIDWGFGPAGANVVLTGIDVLVMKGDKIGALYTFIDPTVSSSVRFGSITLATRPPAAARVLRSRSCAGIDPDGTPGTIA